MNYRKYLMPALTALMLAACSNDGGSHDPVTPADPVNPGLTGKPIVISHRGASGYLPEHTLAAYELAIRMNVDYIEPDLQFTKDGVLVAMHDDTLDRTTNVADLFGDSYKDAGGKYPVSNFTLAEIRTLTVVPAGTAKTSYPGYTPSMADPFKIPTFEEVILFAKEQSVKTGRAIGIYPEAKQADPDMEDGILAALGAHGMNKPDSLVFIQSFSDETIANLRRKQQEQGTRIPQILLGAAVMEGSTAKMGVMGATTKLLDLSEVKKIADGVGVVIAYPTYPVTRTFIEQAHAAGLRVHGWTFGKSDAIAAQKEYREYLDIGMDGMFSNYPDLAVLARDQFNTPNDKFTTDGPVVISHRGSSGYLPEHTLAAYELAIRQRVDYIEPDLQTTSDGVLVAMHDATLDRTTNVADLFATRNGHSNYPVSDFTLAELKTLTVVPVDTSSTEYPGYTPGMAEPFRIPTFQEVIDFAKQQSQTYGRTIGIYPEAKQADPLMENGILKALSDNGLNTASAEVVIQSFSADTVKSLCDKLASECLNRTLVLLGTPVVDGGVAKVRLSGSQTFDGEREVPLSKVATFAKGVGMTISSMTYPLTKEFIDQAHGLGLKVHGWTFNKVDAIEAAEEYYKFLEMGIDGYFSNYPNLGVMARDRFMQK